MKFCVDCKHIRERVYSPPRCDIAPARQNPVTGEADKWYCEAARMPAAPCGPDAILFEPRS